MDDILSLKSEVKQLQSLTQQLEPFVKSFSTGVSAGEMSMAASDATSNQHLQALLDHLARLQMQEPPQSQTQAPTKDHRHLRGTMINADNALYMKGIKITNRRFGLSAGNLILNDHIYLDSLETKEIPTRCRTPSSVGAVLDSSGNIVVYGTAKSSDPKKGVLRELIEKARTKEDRKKSPGRDDGSRDRSQSRCSRKSPDGTKPKTPLGHSSSSKVRSLYRSLKGATGDTSVEALDQPEGCTDVQQQQQQHQQQQQQAQLHQLGKDVIPQVRKILTISYRISKLSIVAVKRWR